MGYIIIPNSGFTFSDVNIPWFVSRGYLVFCPDIHYVAGNTGESVCNSVVSAAGYLSKMPWVDSSRLALNGHSFAATRFSATASGRATAKKASPSRLAMPEACSTRTRRRSAHAAPVRCSPLNPRKAMQGARRTIRDPFVDEVTEHAFLLLCERASCDLVVSPGAVRRGRVEALSSNGEPARRPAPSRAARCRLPRGHKDSDGGCTPQRRSLTRSARAESDQGRGHAAPPVSRT